MNINVENYWKKFIKENKLNEKIIYTEHFYFGNTEEMANDLGKLVLNGTKKATSSLLKQYEIENENIPKVDQYSIVTDFKGNPKCIIKTTNVRFIKYKDMTFDICKLEGEDDNLESWKNKHYTFFKRIADENNFVFNEDLVIVFEEFKLVYK
ncbi:hypothetical protein SLITO_v1c10160 [Spiroplasma litorale]|uniref:ASCH domain-containing protein n=1 Tax=Spiroplasma litorale TaxID=216942 RepID=A0A0K1W3E3_9MOLU|nr:ASCH domain-containing protein [Spiroplasma litorale]AKX34627.1 hypothetical protein SLITO_v1c10160 [Spiroplasma litorale]